MSGNSNSIQNYLPSPLSSQQYPNTTCAGYIYNHMSPSTPSNGGGGGGVGVAGIPSAATSNRFFPYDTPPPSMLGGGGHTPLSQPALLRRTDTGYSNMNPMDQGSPPRRTSFSSGAGSMIAGATATNLGGATTILGNSLSAVGAATVLPNSSSDNLLSLQHIKNFATAHPDYTPRE